MKPLPDPVETDDSAPLPSALAHEERRDRRRRRRLFAHQRHPHSLQRDWPRCPACCHPVRPTLSACPHCNGPITHAVLALFLCLFLVGCHAPHPAPPPAAPAAFPDHAYLYGNGWRYDRPYRSLNLYFEAYEHGQPELGICLVIQPAPPDTNYFDLVVSNLCRTGFADPRLAGKHVIPITADYYSTAGYYDTDP